MFMSKRGDGGRIVRPALIQNLVEASSHCQQCYARDVRFKSDTRILSPDIGDHSTFNTALPLQTEKTIENCRSVVLARGFPSPPL